MSDKAPAWVVPVMRAGYGARGLVYVLVGILALLAAIYGGDAEGTSASLAQLRDQPFGALALWVIAIGLFAYAVWRWVDAAMDLEDYGHDARGIVARLGQTVTGLIHAALGVQALLLAMGRSSGGGQGDGGKAQDWTAQLMSAPYGQWLVGLAGAVTVGAGVYYGYKALAEKYKSHLRRTALTERLDPVVKAGLIAHGIVVAIIGGFLIYAAMTASAGQAGGLGQAFETVRSAPFGRFLLGALALGLIGFAVYCFIEAVYRIVPRRAGSDVKTLAKKAASAA